MLTSTRNESWWLESSASLWCHSNRQELDLSLSVLMVPQGSSCKELHKHHLTHLLTVCYSQGENISMSHSGYTLKTSSNIFQICSIEIIVTTYLTWIQSCWRFGKAKEGDERGRYEGSNRGLTVILVQSRHVQSCHNKSLSSVQQM